MHGLSAFRSRGYRVFEEARRAHDFEEPRAADAPDLGAPESAEQKRRLAEERRLKRLKRLLPLLFGLVFLVYAFTTNFVPSDSMLPNLKPGDHIVTLRAWLAYPGGRMPARDDVVVFTLPREKLPAKTRDVPEAEGRQPIGVFRLPPGEVLVKRVVGLPGDSVWVHDGLIYVNGAPARHEQAIIPGDPDWDYEFSFASGAPLHLGPDEIFVAGDNLPVSEDSRYWGPIHRNQIIGKCLGILFHEGPSGPNEQEVAHAR